MCSIFIDCYTPLTFFLPFSLYGEICVGWKLWERHNPIMLEGVAGGGTPFILATQWGDKCKLQGTSMLKQSTKAQMHTHIKSTSYFKWCLVCLANFMCFVQRESKTLLSMRFKSQKVLSTNLLSQLYFLMTQCIFLFNSRHESTNLYFINSHSFLRYEGNKESRDDH